MIYNTRIWDKDLWISLDPQKVNIDNLVKLIQWEADALRKRYDTDDPSSKLSKFNQGVSDFDFLEFKDNEMMMQSALRYGKILDKSKAKIGNPFDFNKLVDGYLVERIHWQLLKLGSVNHAINFNKNILGYNTHIRYDIPESNFSTERSNNFSISRACGTLNDRYKCVIVVVENCQATVSSIMANELLNFRGNINLGIKVLYLNHDGTVEFSAPVYCVRDIGKTIVSKVINLSTEKLNYEKTVGNISKLFANEKYYVFNDKYHSFFDAYVLGMALRTMSIMRYNEKINHYVLIDKSKVSIPRVKAGDLIDCRIFSGAVTLGYNFDVEGVYYDLGNTELPVSVDIPAIRLVQESGTYFNYANNEKVPVFINKSIPPVDISNLMGTSEVYELK